MSNDTPSRACLADFGFMTAVFDSDQRMACSAQLEGGMVTFMSPELLVPEMYGMTAAKPSPPADIYAFGLVIFQVCKQDHGYYLFYAYFLQVLTGEIPFRGISQSALANDVVRGGRPDRPENASAIGFSDSLWNFTQQCWDGRVESRPTAGEVVTHLGEAAVVWGWLMPPHSQARDVTLDSDEISEPPTVTRLDGEVIRMGDFAFSVGTYCEIWAGLWNKGDRGEADREKVSLSPATHIMLTLLFVGGLENTSSAQVIGEDA